MEATRKREREDKILGHTISLSTTNALLEVNPWNLRAELLRRKERMRGAQYCVQLQIWLLRETMMDGEEEGEGKVQGM